MKQFFSNLHAHFNFHADAKWGKEEYLSNLNQYMTSKRGRAKLFCKWGITVIKTH